MVFSELCGVNIPAEIEYLIKKDDTLGERLVGLLKEVATANESIDLVNLYVLKYILHEVSKEDLLIAINRYKYSKQSTI